MPEYYINVKTGFVSLKFACAYEEFYRSNVILKEVCFVLCLPFRAGNFT